MEEGRVRGKVNFTFSFFFFRVTPIAYVLNRKLIRWPFRTNDFRYILSDPSLYENRYIYL